jgi:hypothetical protein
MDLSFGQEGCAVKKDSKFPGLSRKLFRKKDILSQAQAVVSKSDAVGSRRPKARQ